MMKNYEIRLSGSGGQGFFGRLFIGTSLVLPG